MVLASRLQRVRLVGRVVPGRRRFASAASAASAGSGAGSGGKSGGGVVNHYSASPAYKGRATHNVAYPIRDMDPASFSFADMLRANQRAYNAAHYPTTPVPAVYKAISKVTEAMMTVVYAGAFVAMGLIISTGVWAPYAINYQRRAAEKRFAPLKGEIN